MDAHHVDALENMKATLNDKYENGMADLELQHQRHVTEVKDAAAERLHEQKEEFVKQHTQEMEEVRTLICYSEYKSVTQLLNNSLCDCRRF